MKFNAVQWRRGENVLTDGSAAGTRVRSAEADPQPEAERMEGGWPGGGPREDTGHWQAQEK